MSFSTRWSMLERRLIAALLLVMALPLAASQPALVSRYVDDGRLAGTGRLTWFGFHVYDAALYAPRGFDPRQPYTHSFVLELTYARELSGAAIAAATEGELRRLGFGTQTQRQHWSTQMARLFPDVDEGQRLAGVFQPNAGARFYFNDRFIGAIEDRDFARAFFAIWLDERTRAPRLRESLLKAFDARLVQG